MLCVIQCTTSNDLYPTSSHRLVLGVGCVIIVAKDSCDTIMYCGIVEKSFH